MKKGASRHGARAHHWRIVTTESTPVAPAASLLFQAPVFQAAPEVAAPVVVDEPEAKPKRRRASADAESNAPQEEAAPKRRRRSKKADDAAPEDSAPAAASTTDTTTAGTSAGATPSATPAASTSTDTGTTDTTTAAQQTTTDPHDQTPHDVDDVSTIAQGDVWSYSTTSFNKDAAYNSGGVEDPWSPTGYFTTGDAELDQLVKNYCDSQAQDGLDAGDNAYYTYLHISWIDYVENDQNQRPWDVEGDWRITYAKQCFTNMTANCYEFAAAIQYIMRYYGYADAIAEPCLVLRQSGNWGDHGLVFLTSLDGRQCLIDASLSSNGWLLPASSLSYTLDTGYRAS